MEGGWWCVFVKQPARIMSLICQILSQDPKGVVGEGNGGQTRYRSWFAKERGADETLEPKFEMVDKAAEEYRVEEHCGRSTEKKQKAVRMNVLGQWQKQAMVPGQW